MDAHGRGEHVIHCFADQHGVTAIDLLKAFVQHSAPNQKPPKGTTRGTQVDSIQRIQFGRFIPTGVGNT